MVTFVYNRFCDLLCTNSSVTIIINYTFSLVVVDYVIQSVFADILFLFYETLRNVVCVIRVRLDHAHQYCKFAIDLFSERLF